MAFKTTSSNVARCPGSSYGQSKYDNARIHIQTWMNQLFQTFKDETEFAGDIPSLDVAILEGDSINAEITLVETVFNVPVVMEGEGSGKKMPVIYYEQVNRLSHV
ncbi:MAG: hypothetical protein HQK54_05645 [Oligoflexales bacterium]|nr:hypothetical protein [Oligoflexales bacterium]